MVRLLPAVHAVSLSDFVPTLRNQRDFQHIVIMVIKTI